MSDKIPDNGGYVVAAYLVFLAVVLLYVAIIAMRLNRLSRDVAELDDVAAGGTTGTSSG